MNGVAFSDETMPTKLGPIVSPEVIVNGVKVTALIDTGQPVTLMSLKKAILNLALRKREFSSPQEWRKPSAGCKSVPMSKSCGAPFESILLMTPPGHLGLVSLAIEPPRLMHHHCSS